MSEHLSERTSNLERPPFVPEKTPEEIAYRRDRADGALQADGASVFSTRDESLKGESLGEETLTAERAEDRGAAVPFSRRTATAGSEQLDINPLFAKHELADFRTRWDKVQASFVDEPRSAVKLADGLVADVVDHVSAHFASERKDLEQQWDRSEDVDTESLRQALKRYRAFFDRLLDF